MKPISIRARADADFDTAIDYYLRHEPQVAERFVDELEATFRRITRQPGVGSPRYAELTGIEGLRSMPIKGFGYHVFYIEFDSRVVVVRILHERRNIPALLTDP